MRKFRLYFDKEAEEEWLNEKCNQGWQMTNYFCGVYTFAPCSPGKYTYQVDIPDIQGERKIQEQKRREYIEFVESTGAEYVCSWGYYMIFRKETAKGEFKLYTDAESQIKLYQRMRRLFVTVVIIVLSINMFQIGNYIRILHLMVKYQEVWMYVYFIVAISIISFTIISFLTMIIRLTMRIHQLRSQQ